MLTLAYTARPPLAGKPKYYIYSTWPTDSTSLRLNTSSPELDTCAREQDKLVTKGQTMGG